MLQQFIDLIYDIIRGVAIATTFMAVMVTVVNIIDDVRLNREMNPIVKARIQRNTWWAVVCWTIVLVMNGYL